MGIHTLEEMTQELSLNLQGAVSDQTRLKRWINFGLLNLATFKNTADNLPELKVVQAFPIVAGTTEYDKPADLLAVRTVWANDKRLTYSDRPLINADDEVEEAPRVWSRQGSSIVIWPIPDDDYDDGILEYVKIPERLDARDDVTEFDAGWDLAIIYLATHHGFLGLRQQDEADRWLGRALGYISSRVTVKDLQADTPRAGVNVAWEWDDLRNNPPQYEE